MITKSEPASPCLESSVPLRKHTAPYTPISTALPVSRAYWDPVREDGHVPSCPAPSLETRSTSVEPRTHLTPAELFSATLPPMQLRSHRPPRSPRSARKEFRFKPAIVAPVFDWPTQHDIEPGRGGSGSRPRRYPCEYPDCRTVFERPSSLRQHIRVHTGEKPYECNVCGKKFSISSNARRHDRACHSQEAIQAAASRQLALNKLLEEASSRTYSRDDPSPSSSADEGSGSTRSLASLCPSSPEYQSKPQLLPKTSKMTSPTPGRSFSSVKSLERPRDSAAAISSYYPPSRRSLGISISALLVDDDGEADREMKQEDVPLDMPGTRQTNSAQRRCESIPTTRSQAHVIGSPSLPSSPRRLTALTWI